MKLFLIQHYEENDEMPEAVFACGFEYDHYGVYVQLKWPWVKETTKFEPFMRKNVTKKRYPTVCIDLRWHRS